MVEWSAQFHDKQKGLIGLQKAIFFSCKTN
jgi:hypothetical protein